MGFVAAKRTAAADLTAALPLPKAGGWLGAAQAEARARLAATGLPHRRDEYWRYTDPAPLVAAEAEGAPSDAPSPFGALGALRFVFVDGVLDAAGSADLAEAGLEVGPLAAAGDWAARLCGRLEARGQSPVERPMATLNMGFATGGLAIRATAPVARPVEILYRSTRPGSDPILRHLVLLEAGASLTLLESGQAGARANIVTEVEVGAGAEFNHIRTQGPARDRLVTTGLFAGLAAEARLKSLTLAAEGRLTRNEAIVELSGDGGSAHLAGIALGTGGMHHDDTVFVTHDATHCESRQVFKKVLSGGATGVFQGKILVRPGAQKTDGYQISQSLLLDDAAVFLAKPELEIYADDVKCSHGSTSGAIDPVALHYLRARGVPRAEAEKLLVRAFLAEALSEIADPAAAEAVEAQLGDWLGAMR